MRTLLACAAMVCLVLEPGAPAGAAALGPAAPVDLYATNGATWITLSWTQPATGTRPAYFQVYENGAVVARNTTTHLTLSSLVFGGSHTYTVTAVAGGGQESPPSAPITRSAFQGGPFGCGLTTPTGLTASAVTASGVSLSWSNAEPYYDQPGTLVVLVDSVATVQTSLDSARISGLAPSSTHTFQVARRDCNGTLHTSTAITVTTAAGGTARPAAPTSLTAGTVTNSSVALSWTGTSGDDPTVGYVLYNGAARVAAGTATATTATGLWRATGHQFSVAAVDAAGNESAQSSPVAVSTLACDQPVPAPVSVGATAVSASSVALSWQTISEYTQFTVYRLTGASAVPVAVTPNASVRLTGLPSATGAVYAVAAQDGACGTSANSAPVTATTLPGPAARPAPPTGLRVVSRTPSATNTAVVTLSWVAPTSTDPIVGYRLYEGSTLFATSATTGVTLTLPAGPTHAIVAVGVDAAGNESAPSPLLSFMVPYIPLP